MRLLLVGAGNMGFAMAQGWLEMPGLDVVVLRPRPKNWLDQGTDFDRFHVVSSPESLKSEAFDAVVLAVKPHKIAEVTSELMSNIASADLVISVAAGTPLTQLKTFFANSQPIVRVMPNVPAAIGLGACVCVGDIDDAKKQFVNNLLRPLGSVHWIDDEELMHPVIALCGSGPAYFFLLADIMAKQAMKMGISPELAQTLAGETIFGAGGMLTKSSRSADELKKSVASPGGTTEAALRVLEGEKGLEEIMISAMEACASRSQELARGD